MAFRNRRRFPEKQQERCGNACDRLMRERYRRSRRLPTVSGKPSGILMPGELRSRNGQRSGNGDALGTRPVMSRINYRLLRIPCGELKPHFYHGDPAAAVNTNTPSTWQPLVATLTLLMMPVTPGIRTVQGSSERNGLRHCDPAREPCRCDPDRCDPDTVRRYLVARWGRRFTATSQAAAFQRLSLVHRLWGASTWTTCNSGPHWHSFCIIRSEVARNIGFHLPRVSF